MVEAIQELQDAGVEPDLWKIEGLDRREDCEHVVAAARAGGRDMSAASFSVAARTTGKSANGSTTAAAVPGFIGFAVGRTVFWDPLVAWRSKQATREQAVAEIARRYREFVDIFERKDASRVSCRLVERPTGTSFIYGGLSHAARNDRPWPDGRRTWCVAC